jgi:hypothetical protein
LHALVLTSLGIWFVFLPFTQPEQQLRHRVEQELKDGRIAEALAEMSIHSPSHFPPQWDPPPQLALGQLLPPLLDVMEAIADQPPAPWVRSIYLEKLRNLLHSPYSISESKRVAKLLIRLPEGKEVLEALGGSEEDFLRQKLQEEIKDLERDDKTPVNQGNR